MGRFILVLAALTAISSVASQAAPPKINLAPPVTLREWSETYGDWTVQYLAGESTVANVTNSAGHVLGAICDKSGCEAFFNPQLNCTDGNSYPALVNAPSGSFYVDLKCLKAGERFLYSTPLDGDMSEAMSVGGVLGIAFPMASGKFEVSRFSLTGAARATARASQVARGPSPSNRQEASDNFSL